MCSNKQLSYRVNRCAHAVLSALLVMSTGNAFAGPTGGQVVGGAGSINQSGLNTTINQTTQNMAINWQSYNVNVDERVQYIQPNSSSVSLNRILSNNGSTIAGRIDANGQVILVNPNGIFFTPTSIVNLGGIIASGLDIAPSDFMNGNYIFNEVLGTDGTVINSGTINASLGGNVALIGKQVANDGFIVANLGTVSLAAGKQAVLTFDNGGLLGVRVSEEILQDELGVDPAVMNSGEIQAEGGRVLLTASTSQDVFSQAVNTNGLDQAISVVVHEDGSFTLGGGADVINTGRIDTSTTSSDQPTGRIVLLGENVTSSGELHADAANGNGGEIELHAQDETLMTEDSVTSARSEVNGQGGIVKVLGDKVGLFDQSTVDVSGANGGGQAMIGGDYQGNNPHIRNARMLFVSRDAIIAADAISSGNGGRILNWSDDMTWFYGTAYARGGELSGDGGLVEVSGKEFLNFKGYVDTTAAYGDTGLLLLDPVNITILNGTGDSNGDGDTSSSSFFGCDNYGGGNCNNSEFGRIEGSDAGPSSLYESELEGIGSSTNILLAATNNITINELTTDGVLNLLATSGSITFRADSDDNGTGSFSMNSSNTIRTQGGDVTIRGATVAVGNVNTTGATGQDGGNIEIRSRDGNVTVGNLTSVGGAASLDNNGRDGGDVTLRTEDNAGTNDRITINGNITTDGSAADGANTGGNAGRIDIRTGDSAGGEDSVALNGNLSAQGGNSTNPSNVGDNDTISIDTPLLITTGTRTISTARDGDTGNNGSITISDGDSRLSRLNLGGSLMLEAGVNDNVNFQTLVDYNGIASNSTLTLNAGNNVTFYSVSDSDTGSADRLNISLNSNTDGGSLGNVIINGIIDQPVNVNTGGGAFAVTGVNYDGESASNSKITINTGSGDASLTMTGSVLLGEMNVGGDLTVSGNAADGNGNVISQGTSGPSNDVLSVTGTASFSSTAVTGEITLDNNNNLQGVTRFSTPGSNNASLRNTATTTTLGATAQGTFNVGGALTVNATQDLTLANDITVGGASLINFGLDNNGRTFAAQSGIIYTAGSSTITGGAGNDVFNLNTNLAGAINGGDGNDIFNVNSSTTGNINGQAGNDTFNINATGVTLTLVGGTETDTVRGPDSANFWIVDSAGGGTLDQTAIADATVVNFSEMETLTGGTGTGVDTFTVNAGASIGTLSGLDGNDEFTVNGVVTTINGGDGADDIGITGTAGTAGSVAAGAGDDMITIVNAASVTGLIDGEDGTDTLTVTGDGVAIALGTDADRIENLDATGTGPSPHTLTGSDAAANTWDISASGNSVDDGTTSTTFTGFSILNAGSAGDDFTVNVTGISTINGSDPGNDAITLATAGLVATVNGGDNGAADNDSLTILAGTNTWSVDANDDGSVTIAGSIPPADTTTFTSIETRIASSDGNDSIDLSDVPLVLLENYQNFGTLRGNNTGTLQGTNNQNDWFIEDFDGADSLSDGVNDGRVEVGAITTHFIDFLNLTGGDGIDNFTIDTTGSITGTISGGIGMNSLTGRNAGSTWTITANNTGFIDTAEATPARYVQLFTAIQEINGGDGNDTFTFNIDPAGTGMTINGGADPGFDTADLSGLADITVSLANFPGMERIIGTNDGSNTNSSMLIGANGQTNTWRIEDVDGSVSTVADGINDGSLNGTEFINFNHLVGGNATDNFVVAVGGTLPNGLIDGMGGDNTIDIQNAGIGTVEIGDRINSSLNIFQIGDVTGNGTTQLLSDSDIATNNWAVTNMNAGTINQGTANQVVFTNFDRLGGNTSNDIFSLHDVIEFTGTISGGTGNNQLIAGNRAINSWIITGGSTGTVTGLSGGFSNIQTLTGNAGQDIFQLHDTANFAGSINGAGGAGDTLYAGNRTNTWQITGSTTGTVTGLTGGFSNIETLTGNAQQDIFTLHNTLDFAGAIEGGEGGASDELRAGNRTNTWEITGATAGTVTGLTGGFSNIEILTGNAGQDIFTLHDTFDFAGSVDGAGGVNDQVIGGNRQNTWTITGANNTGTVAGLSGTFSNVEQLTGNNAQDNFSLHASVDFAGNIDGGGGTSNTLTGGARANSWTIDAADGGTVTGLSAGNTFTNIQNLNGSAGNFNDTFTFQNGGSITGLISGGPQALVNGEDVVDMSGINADLTVRIGVGQDIVGIERVIGNNNGVSNNPYNSELVGENNNNDWTISGMNSGSVDGVNFVNFNNLTGNSGNDNFVIASGGRITGLIDGGGPNRDSWRVTEWTPFDQGIDAGDVLDLSQLADVDIVIDTDFTNIELVIGNTDGTSPDNSTLRSGQGNNDWLILGPGTGVVNATEFTQFDNIVGGAGDDTFLVQADFEGGIAGGDGAGTDSIDYSALASHTVQLGGSLGISGIEQVIGNGAGFVMRGMDDAENTWSITGQNSGSVSAGAENLIFVNFHNLEGSIDRRDIFNVRGGSISGTVNGRGGNDTLDVQLRANQQGQILFVGGSGDNDVIIDVASGVVYDSGAYSPGVTGGYDQFRYIDGTASFDIRYNGEINNVTDNMPVNAFTINSSGDNDVIQLGFNADNGNNIFRTNSSVAGIDVDITGKPNITVSALNGSDVEIAGNVNLAGTLTLTADQVTETAGAGITADTLVLQNTGTVGASGDGLSTNINNLRVIDTGAVYIAEQNDLVLAELNTTGLLDIVANGTLTSTAALSSSGALNIQAGGDITLSGANQLSGPISLSEGNADAADNNNTFTLNNTLATDLNQVSTQHLNIASNGNLTDSGTIISTGTSTISSAGDIVLDSAGNDFAVVNLAGNGVASITDSNSIGIGTLSADHVSVAAGGQITDANGVARNIDAQQVTLRAATGIGSGDVLVTYTGNAGAFAVQDTDAIEMSTANLSVVNTDSGTVNVDNARDVTIQDLRNRGDIILTNAGDIEFAVTAGAGGTLGAIDANYNGSIHDPVYAGDVAIEGNGPSDITTLGIGLGESDITAESLLVNGFSQFGSVNRPIRLRINRQFTLVTNTGTVTYPNGPPDNVTSNADLLTIDGATGLSGQQLIEIESLGDVDEAIFTEVRNYYHEDVAIMLPADQRMTDDEDEEERRRREAVN